MLNVASVCVCVLMVCHLLYRTPLGDITNATGSRAKRHRFPQSVLFTVGTADSVCVCFSYCSVKRNSLHEFHVCFMYVCYLLVYRKAKRSISFPSEDKVLFQCVCAGLKIYRVYFFYTVQESSVVTLWEPEPHLLPPPLTPPMFPTLTRLCQLPQEQPPADKLSPGEYTHTLEKSLI